MVPPHCDRCYTPKVSGPLSGKPLADCPCKLPGVHPKFLPERLPEKAWYVLQLLADTRRKDGRVRKD